MDYVKEAMVNRINLDIKELLDKKYKEYYKSISFNKFVSDKCSTRSDGLITTIYVDNIPYIEYGVDIIVDPNTFYMKEL